MYQGHTEGLILNVRCMQTMIPRHYEHFKIVQDAEIKKWTSCVSYGTLKFHGNPYSPGVIWV